MNTYQNYGVVYTPRKLASFVADILMEDGIPIENSFINILDPACGEGILLEELANRLKEKGVSRTHYYGIDVEEDVIAEDRIIFDEKEYTFIAHDTILPSDSGRASDYWRHELQDISCVIANPPWSSEKVFDKKDLDRAGYLFDAGQYDSYVLFMELCLKIVSPDAVLAFIIPDSLFSGEKKGLRDYLARNTEIRAVARLGEKFFPDINRAASVIVLKNRKPGKNSKTRCYRLDTPSRKAFFNGKLDLYDNYHEKNHVVSQERFLHNRDCVFDIDAREEDEALLKKIAEGCMQWQDVFRFGRGVEISKSGAVVTCDHCGMAQGYTKKQRESGTKKCQFCGEDIVISESNVSAIISDLCMPGFVPIYVGENLHRYRLDGAKYIKPGVNGINYKDEKLYNPPKILVRKTGMGIYACIDFQSTYVSQTVYCLNFTDAAHTVPMEYYLAVLNSRLVYYYYLKKYGENEWKTHPYLTREIIFSLPVKKVTDSNRKKAQLIAQKTRDLQKHYSRELDMQVERMILDLYGITPCETGMIVEELNRLPDLSAVNGMKVREGELDVQVHRE